jgi:hypothetical protein
VLFSERKHGPLPFSVETINQYGIVDDIGGLVATMEAGSDIRRKPDAEFIAKACNSYYELRAALEEARDALEEYREYGNAMRKHDLGFHRNCGGLGIGSVFARINNVIGEKVRT